MFSVGMFVILDIGIRNHSVKTLICNVIMEVQEVLELI